MELSNVGFYSVAPYLAMVLFENTWATVMDAQMNAGKLSLLNLRRLSQTVAFGCPAAVIAVMLGVGTSTPWVASASTVESAVWTARSPASGLSRPSRTATNNSSTSVTSTDLPVRTTRSR